MTELTDETLYPLYAQKEAENMVSEIIYPKKDRVLFLLITPISIPVECVWLDPCLGMFAVKGRESIGFTTINSLPKGSLIVNQRYESEDKK